ncbi:hypothetical protein [Streptomyces sp. NPDC093223]|uniref:hypothetical protein n=1 Tax=Streptomyces sp. NPDC093223 TaxID=3366033 RepID=UPI0037F760EF
MGEDPDAVVADGYLQATGSSGLSGVRLGSYIGTTRAAPMADGIVDQLTDAAGNLSTRGRTKVGNREKTYALTYVVGGVRGQESGLKESRAMVTPVVERNGSDDRGALGKLGEEVHPLQVRGDTRIGGETKHTLTGHDRSSLSECGYGCEVEWTDELQPRGVDGEGLAGAAVENQVSAEQRVASDEFE